VFFSVSTAPSATQRPSRIHSFFPLTIAHSPPSLIVIAAKSCRITTSCALASQLSVRVSLPPYDPIRLSGPPLGRGTKIPNLNRNRTENADCVPFPPFPVLSVRALGPTGSPVWVITYFFRVFSCFPPENSTPPFSPCSAFFLSPLNRRVLGSMTLPSLVLLCEAQVEGC